MGFFDNIFDMFKTGDKRDKRNNTASNNEVTNMKDTHVSMGEDSGSLASQEEDEDRS